MAFYLPLENNNSSLLLLHLARHKIFTLSFIGSDKVYDVCVPLANLVRL